VNRPTLPWDKAGYRLHKNWRAPTHSEPGLATDISVQRMTEAVGELRYDPARRLVRSRDFPETPDSGGPVQGAVCRKSGHLHRFISIHRL
jgi:hypothetical protein